MDIVAYQIVLEVSQCLLLDPELMSGHGQTGDHSSEGHLWPTGRTLSSATSDVFSFEVDKTVLYIFLLQMEETVDTLYILVFSPIVQNPMLWNLAS